jgi:hypothetical protein
LKSSRVPGITSMSGFVNEKNKIARTTHIAYASHIKLYFKPTIGDIRIDFVLGCLLRQDALS